MGENINQPPSSRLAARVRIKPEYQHEVESLLGQSRICPTHKEMGADGDVSYWFSKEQQVALAAVLERMPLDHWAHYMVAGAPPLDA